jgi:ABC-type sugar transport system permease subunit
VTIFYAVIFVIPFGTAIWLSFQNWDFITKPRFVGFRNYVTMFKSLQFWQALKTSILFSAVEISVGVSLALLLAAVGPHERVARTVVPVALLLALRHPRGRDGLPLALALPQRAAHSTLP